MNLVGKRCKEIVLKLNSTKTVEDCTDIVVNGRVTEEPEEVFGNMQLHKIEAKNYKKTENSGSCH